MPDGKLMSAPKASSDDCIERVVTITVLSCYGLLAKKYDPNNLVWKRRQVVKTTTGLVASFSQNASGDKSLPLLTDVPSMPIENLDASCMFSKLDYQSIVHWPPSVSVDACSGDSDEVHGKVLSTFRFKRTFRREESIPSTMRFLPETCSINISLSRCGKLINLGQAELIISGEEIGDSSTIIPISTSIKKKGVSSPVRKSNVKGRIPMIRIKGDDMQFGLKDDSKLRVLVSVTDKHDGTDDAQSNECLQEGFEDSVDNDESESCEVNSVTFEVDDGYESFLQFLSGEKNAEDIRKQGSELSPLSCENGITYCGGEDENENDAPKLPLVEDFAGGSTIKMQAGDEEERKDEPNEFVGEMTREKTRAILPSQSLLKMVCEKLDFDFAEMWLRIDASKHRLVHYHASDALDESVRQQVIDVYEGEAAFQTKHRLSAALCKLTRTTGDIMKITTQSPNGAEALGTSLVDGVNCVMAVPFCHEPDINLTVLAFCLDGATTDSQLEGDLMQKGDEILLKIAHVMTGL